MKKKTYFQCNYNNGLDDFALISMQPAYNIQFRSSTIILTNSSYFIHFTIHTQEINLVHAFSELNQWYNNDDHKQLALQSSLLLCFPFRDYSIVSKARNSILSISFVDIFNNSHIIRRMVVSVYTDFSGKQKKRIHFDRWKHYIIWLLLYWASCNAIFKKNFFFNGCSVLIKVVWSFCIFAVVNSQFN